MILLTAMGCAIPSPGSYENGWGSAIPLWRGVEGCVSPFNPNSINTPQASRISTAPPLKRGI
jgi:hypothetical protein